MIPLALPAGYSRIRRVECFEELIATRFADGVNALYWPRTLTGDFREVALALGVGLSVFAAVVFVWALSQPLPLGWWPQ